MTDETRNENEELLDENKAEETEAESVGQTEKAPEEAPEEATEGETGGADENNENKEEAVEEKKETYAFRWEYSEQTINDKSREDRKKTGREKGIIAYAVIMTVAFLLAFSILAASLALNNAGGWFAPAPAASLSVSDIVDIGMPSTFAVFASIGDGKGSMGTGFALTKTGYIMTNYHVVDNAVSIWVMDIEYVEYSASLVGYDEELDIAILFAESANFTPITIGDSDTVRLGETAVAIGCPNGDELLFSVSNGIISGKNRTDSNGKTMLQTNAPLNPGNSGGPLFDSNGRVVGVVTSKLTTTTTESGEKIALEGIAFAVPINDAMELAETVITEDLERPMLGVSAVSVEADNSYYFCGDTGRLYPHMVIDGKDYYQNEYGETVVLTNEVLSKEGNYIFYADVTGIAIVGVTKGLGADGVLEINDIVTEVDGVAVKSVAEVKAVFVKFSAGDRIAVTYYRNGEIRESSMILKTKGDMLAAEERN